MIITREFLGIWVGNSAFLSPRRSRHQHTHRTAHNMIHSLCVTLSLRSPAFSARFNGPAERPGPSMCRRPFSFLRTRIQVMTRVPVVFSVLHCARRIMSMFVCLRFTSSTLARFGSSEILSLFIYLCFFSAHFRYIFVSFVHFYCRREESTHARSTNHFYRSNIF